MSIKALGDNFDDDEWSKHTPRSFSVDNDWDPSILPTGMRTEKVKSMIREVLDVSVTIPRRTNYEVLAALMEEVGELATEVNISTGFSRKEAGEDGICGEAIDVIICALDMIWISSPNTTEDELELYIIKRIKEKIAKWKLPQL